MTKGLRSEDWLTVIGIPHPLATGKRFGMSVLAREHVKTGGGAPGVRLVRRWCGIVTWIGLWRACDGRVGGIRRPGGRSPRRRGWRHRFRWRAGWKWPRRHCIRDSIFLCDREARPIPSGARKRRIARQIGRNNYSLDRITCTFLRYPADRGKRLAESPC